MKQTSNEVNIAAILAAGADSRMMFVFRSSVALNRFEARLLEFGFVLAEHPNIIVQVIAE